MMYIKQNLRNICVSFLFLILFDLIYLVFYFVVDYFIGIEIVLTVIAIALFSISPIKPSTLSTRPVRACM